MLRRLFERGLPLSGVGSNETTGLSIYDWAKMFALGAQVNYNGNRYQAYRSGGSPGGDHYSSNPVVFSLAAKRILIFAEVRFQWQQLRNGRPGDLFTNPDLQILEVPWAGHTTRDMLAQAELDICVAGNSYWVRNGGELQRLDPANTKILTSKATDEAVTGWQIGERLEGYVYAANPRQPVIYPAEDVCHYKPLLDPNNRHLGMSWLNPCLPDIQTDNTITAHKLAVIGNGAALTTIVNVDPNASREQFDGFVDTFRRQHERPENAAKTLFLSGATDIKTVGQTFENLMLQATQGASEVRIAAAAGVPPTIAGFSEGLKGSSLNAGNYGEARRSFADLTIRPLWKAFAGAMSSLIPTPGGARLFYDDRDVAFLREDLADQAQITETNATAILKLVQGGWDPDAAIEAILTGDLGRLTGKHSGLYSVQLIPPGEGTFNTPPAAPAVAPSSLSTQKNGKNGKQPALTP
jgi:phage portal protein BeeE